MFRFTEMDVLFEESKTNATDDLSVIIRKFVHNENNFDAQYEAYSSILRLTNYRLPLTRSQQNMSKRDEEQIVLITRIREEWAKNESGWRLQLLSKDNFTRCRAIRSNRGSYSYVDMDTKQPISCEEYQDRYQAYLKISKHKYPRNIDSCDCFGSNSSGDEAKVESDNDSSSSDSDSSPFPTSETVKNTQTVYNLNENNRYNIETINDQSQIKSINWANCNQHDMQRQIKKQKI
eukprot:gene6732-9226_t